MELFNFVVCFVRIGRFLENVKGTDLLVYCINSNNRGDNNNGCRKKG